MPQDTTIYWDGNGQMPAAMDSLSAEQQQLVFQLIRDAQSSPESNELSAGAILAITFIILLTGLIIYAKLKSNKSLFQQPVPDLNNQIASPNGEGPQLVYSGSKLKFSDQLLDEVLIKRFAYYQKLDEADRTKFVQRLKKFIAIKTFVIHDSSGYKEMPILISATAIQISFGLDKYLLPHFNVFNIYPREFLGTYPFFRFLLGNVSGNTINLSWKNFMDGYTFPGDGQNVGIHELAHALYYQTFVVEKHIDKKFKDTFIDFDNHGNKVYDLEKKAGKGLYTSYAMKDFQEFWAESVEIFFEKPIQMKAIYPSLYAAISDLLNQDPAATYSGNVT
ncbi:MAG: zinc-dependent peptidase [Ferruginibacter sp.]